MAQRRGLRRVARPALVLALVAALGTWVVLRLGAGGGGSAPAREAAHHREARHAALAAATLRSADGIDVAAVEAAAATLEGGKPRLYDVAGGVRYAALAVGPTALAPRLADAATRVRDALVASGAELYVNPTHTLHVTVFHASRAEAPVHLDEAQKEAAARKFAGAARGIGAVHLIVERVVLLPTGSLVALLRPPGREEGGGPSPIDELRERCRRAWPDAPAQQAAPLIHTTMGRVVKAPRPGVDFEGVANAVAAASRAVQGARVVLDALWIIEERRINAATLDAPPVVVPLKGR